MTEIPVVDADQARPGLFPQCFLDHENGFVCRPVHAGGRFFSIGGDLKVFWSNGLVGSITTLAIVCYSGPRLVGCSPGSDGRNGPERHRAKEAALSVIVQTGCA